MVILTIEFGSLENMLAGHPAFYLGSVLRMERFYPLLGPHRINAEVR